MYHLNLAAVNVVGSLTTINLTNKERLRYMCSVRPDRRFIVGSPQKPLLPIVCQVMGNNGRDDKKKWVRNPCGVFSGSGVASMRQLSPYFPLASGAAFLLCVAFYYIEVLTFERQVLTPIDCAHALLNIIWLNVTERFRGKGSRYASLPSMDQLVPLLN